MIRKYVQAKTKSYKHQIFAAKGYDSNCATIPVLENDYNNAPDSCRGQGYSCKTKEEVLALKTTAEADCETDKQDCTNFLITYHYNDITYAFFDLIPILL